VIIDKKEEKEILASVKKEASPKEIKEAITTRAESCVDSRCGCQSKC
jgi:hypothetical protein